ncbi:hypothetical protein [Dinghuibacter silviterrae]|uniref:Uncharacterized protein n=1 Tax=Dinghuibacter silviterrae TaxID=1539049 RepID=A0A4R8DJ12_9BACT|nr:hypothetical protein [Dinghuibacter silviterrae]TDW96990.1 hypothetical protein EDB95_4826 [Dinghuibacter silviterrae]
MRNLLFFVVLLSCIPAGCKKDGPSFNDLSGDSTIRSVVLLYDTLAGNGQYIYVHPISVYLKYPSDSTGYLTYATSSVTGQFSFNGIDPGQAYVVYASFDSLQLHFSGMVTFPANSRTSVYASDTLKLYPTATSQNILVYRLVDPLGGAVPGGSLYLFSSQTLWAQSDSIGASYILRTDNFGRSVQTNILPGPYYVHAVGFPTGQLLTATDTLTMPVSGIISRVLPLITTGNELIYRTFDSLSDPLADCKVYLFSSRVLWENAVSFTGTPAGSVYSFSTDSTGETKEYNLAPGKYFIYAYNRYDSLKLQGVDSVILPPGGVKDTSITLKVL